MLLGLTDPDPLVRGIRYKGYKVFTGSWAGGGEGSSEGGKWEDSRWGLPAFPEEYNI